MDKNLRAIAKWGKFLGYAFIVMGVLYALFTFWTVIGIGYGAIFVFLGLYLLRSGKQAETLLRQYDERALYELLENYAKFLKLNGIVLIIGLVLMVVGLVFMIGTGFMFGEMLSDYSYYY